jgi:hypothetical protein
MAGLMSIKDFKAISTENDELDRVQDNVSLFTQPLVDNPLLDGRLLEDVILTTSEVLVEHKLGRKPRGWYIVKKNAAQDIHESGTTLQERFLSLTAAGTVTVSLWVF